MAHKAENIHYLDLYRESLLISGLARELCSAWVHTEALPPPSSEC